MKGFILLVYAIVLNMILSSSCQNETLRLFAGKFTVAGEKGLYLFDLNGNEGTFKIVSESDAGPSPSYFCLSKERGLIYAANIVSEFKGIQGGGLTTLKFDSNGVVEKISELTIPNGGPCYISLSPDKGFLFIANYPKGSVVVVKLDESGVPVSITDFILYETGGEKVSHAHMIAPDPSGKRVYVTDLGLDQIVIYKFDTETGKLQQIPNGIVKLAEGAGPRHFVFSSDGTRMYVINELNSTISSFVAEVNGELTPLQTLTTLKKGFTGNSYCADIHIGKDGKYLYGSNRGENTLVVFNIATDGVLSLAGHMPCGGDWPRNFVIDPSGKFILVGNERSGNISLFKIDKKTGIPIAPGKDYKVPRPACLKFFI